MTWQVQGNQYTAARAMFEQIKADQAAQGAEFKPYGFQGYQGRMYGSLFLGYREDGLMLRASSHYAKYAEAKIRQSKLSGHPTRLDFQNTAQVGPQENDYGRRVRKEVEQGTASSRRTARTNLAIYKNFGSDSGFTIGARSAERYARFYNKTLEQRNRVAKGLWRYEVELKGRAAQAAWNELTQGVRCYDLSQAICQSHFSRYGLDMSWLKECQKFELPSSYHPTSIEKKLNWFSGSVRGSVEDCIAAGKLEEVLARLGLTDHVEIL